MTDRRRASEQPGQDDNPFAPPPADRPDQPWQPRRRSGDESGGDGSEGSTGSPDPWGPPSTSGSGNTSGSDDSSGSDDEQAARKRWGSQWSSRQPGRGGGGFGNRNGNGDQPDGSGGNGGNGNGGGPGGMRWDPRDPVQRHSRYAMLSGMWGLFFALFNIPPIALLLGALALYWGISALRGAPGVTRKDADASAERRGTTTAGDLDGSTPPGTAAATAGRTARQQTTAAVSGVVIGSLALLIVAATFTFQLVYQDYYNCVEDALTTTSRESCERHLPEQLRPLLGERE
ncbi:hypothetical protein [Streptomyces sparsus]